MTIIYLLLVSVGALCTAMQTLDAPTQFYCNACQSFLPIDTCLEFKATDNATGASRAYCRDCVESDNPNVRYPGETTINHVRDARDAAIAELRNCARDGITRCPDGRYVRYCIRHKFCLALQACRKHSATLKSFKN